MLSVEEEKISALQAELKSVRNKHKQGMKSKGGNKSDTATTTNKMEDCKDMQSRKNPQKTSWMEDKPKEENLHKPKSWSNKNCYWCTPETGGKYKGH